MGFSSASPCGWRGRGVLNSSLGGQFGCADQPGENKPLFSPGWSVCFRLTALKCSKCCPAGSPMLKAILASCSVV